MSRFFVGQRVRLSWKRDGSTSSTPIGQTGTIVRKGPWAPGELSNLGGDVLVQWDGLTSATAIYSQLEPILPSGHQPSEYSFDRLMDSLREVMA